MNRKTLTILVVILLIFLYWMSKRKGFKVGCADIWDDMNNVNAQQFFYETMSMIDNNPDIQGAVQHNSRTNQTAYDFEKCNYATQYMMERDANPPIITKLEATKIEQCICAKFKM